MNHFEQSLIRAFQAAFARHEELGEQGLEEIRKNQFGETALKMDVEAEAAVLESFKKDNLPIRVVSEEHGIVDIGTPEYLAVLDGIDGSALYKKERARGKYGTMIGIFKGTNPTYAEYLLGGTCQHATKRILIGIKNQGAFAINLPEETRTPIRTSGHTSFDTNTRMYIDEYFDTNREVFSKPLTRYNTTYKQASALYYADVAEGLADFALECTRKNNLELAAAYPLIREAGGVMVDLNGNDIGSHPYLTFGAKEQIHVITAATKELAEHMVAFLKKS